MSFENQRDDSFKQIMASGDHSLTSKAVATMLRKSEINYAMLSSVTPNGWETQLHAFDRTISFGKGSTKEQSILNCYSPILKMFVTTRTLLGSPSTVLGNTVYSATVLGDTFAADCNAWALTEKGALKYAFDNYVRKRMLDHAGLIKIWEVDHVSKWEEAIYALCDKRANMVKCMILGFGSESLNCSPSREEKLSYFSRPGLIGVGRTLYYMVVADLCLEQKSTTSDIVEEIRVCQDPSHISKSFDNWNLLQYVYHEPGASKSGLSVNSKADFVFALIAAFRYGLSKKDARKLCNKVMICSDQFSVRSASNSHPSSQKVTPRPWLSMSLPPCSGKTYLTSLHPDLFLDGDVLMDHAYPGWLALDMAQRDELYREMLKSEIPKHHDKVILHPCWKLGPLCRDFILTKDVMSSLIAKRPLIQRPNLEKWYAERSCDEYAFITPTSQENLVEIATSWLNLPYVPTYEGTDPSFTFASSLSASLNISIKDKPTSIYQTAIPSPRTSDNMMDNHMANSLARIVTQENPHVSDSAPLTRSTSRTRSPSPVLLDDGFLSTFSDIQSIQYIFMTATSPISAVLVMHTLKLNGKDIDTRTINRELNSSGLYVQRGFDAPLHPQRPLWEIVRMPNDRTLAKYWNK